MGEFGTGAGEAEAGVSEGMIVIVAGSLTISPRTGIDGAANAGWQNVQTNIVANAVVGRIGGFDCRMIYSILNASKQATFAQLYGTKA